MFGHGSVLTVLLSEEVKSQSLLSSIFTRFYYKQVIRALTFVRKTFREMHLPNANVLIKLKKNQWDLTLKR